MRTWDTASQLYRAHPHLCSHWLAHLRRRCLRKCRSARVCRRGSRRLRRGDAKCRTGETKERAVSATPPLSPVRRCTTANAKSCPFCGVYAFSIRISGSAQDSCKLQRGQCADSWQRAQVSPDLQVAIVTLTTGRRPPTLARRFPAHASEVSCVRPRTFFVLPSLSPCAR